MNPATPARRAPRRVVAWLGLAVLVGFGGASSCAPTQQLVVGDLAGEGGSGPECARTGEVCGEPSDCCGQMCDLGSGRCARPISACQGAGAPCATALDCCGLSCREGLCGAACQADGADCDTGAECCSGSCTRGTCAALSTTCLTAGNPCELSSECCSGLCDEERCSMGSSYCSQPGDVCRTGADCCTGICSVDDGASLGACGSTPSGASNCAGGVSGLLCTSCNDCCSRLCAPYEESGVSICMPPGGCRVTGEICRNDADCCGGDPTSALPGAGSSACERAVGAEVGVCRNAMGCSPLGNVCHLADYACSISAASNRCCDGTEATECALDGLGVPRCSARADACAGAGALCASSADCCDGAPCVRDEGGTLRCHAAACARAGEACTAPSDCCSELSCLVAVGSQRGVCAAEEP